MAEYKPSRDDAMDVLSMAMTIQTTVKVMHQMGMTRQEAIDGFTRAIDHIWPAPTEREPA